MDVIYDDKTWFIAVNKPPGVATQPDSTGTFMRVRAYVCVCVWWCGPMVQWRNGVVHTGRKNALDWVRSYVEQVRRVVAVHCVTLWAHA